MDKVRLGTIGSGSIVYSILDGAKKNRDVEFSAVYSRSEEKGNQLADEYGFERVYTDMDEFLRDGEMNTVYIAAPNSLHYTYAKRALLAGKNVILEKPFCPTAAEARELIDIAEKTGLMIVDATPTFFLPNLAALKELLPSIGKIRLVEANYTQYSSRYNDFLKGKTANVFNPKYCGGALMDINYYNIYLNVALFGLPEKAGYYPNIQRDIDTSGIAVLKYDGFVSQCTGSKDAYGESFFLIEGEKGFLRVPDGSNGIKEVDLINEDDEVTYDNQFNDNRWLHEMKGIIPLLLNEDRKKIREGLNIMLKTITLIEEIRRKAGIYFPGDNID